MSDSIDASLHRARQHFQRALVEALEAGLALLEAGAAARRDPGANGALLQDLAQAIEAAIRPLRDAGRFEVPRGLLDPLEQALETEIARWEARSRTDPGARPVLRAFLGLRELVWEITRRSAPPAPPAEGPDSEPHPARAARRPAPPRRVQRFDVES